MSIEDNLKVIKNAKLDIELLRRKNEKLCEANNKDIDNFVAVIKDAEEMLEVNLKESGEKKLECKLGYAGFRSMPDKWEYDDEKIIFWCKGNNQPYYHTKEILERLKLKNAINDNTIKLSKPDDVPGITVTPQEHKFNYKIK